MGDSFLILVVKLLDNKPQAADSGCNMYNINLYLNMENQDLKLGFH